MKSKNWTLRKLGEPHEGSQFYIVERPPVEFEYQFSNKRVGDVNIKGNDLILDYFLNYLQRTVRIKGDTQKEIEQNAIDYLNNQNNLEFFNGSKVIL